MPSIQWVGKTVWHQCRRATSCQIASLAVHFALCEKKAIDMRDSIANFDWSATPLGPRDRWPPSLRTIVDMMVSSPTAMCIGWGPELTMIYNEGYAPILGARHPGALGKPWAEAWPDVWDEISPLIEDALAERSVSFQDMHLVMTRNGYMEDTWWSFSYSPLYGDDGAVAGFVDIVTDSTAKVLSERRSEEEGRRYRTSEERFRALVNASSDVVYRMSADWQEMRQLDGRGFLADTDAPSVRWIEAYLPEQDRPHILATIDKAIARKATFELEHRVVQADGSIGWTLSRAIPILDDAGQIVEWFGMAADISERRRNEELLQLIVNELNHRVKNNLAMVQAIAMQTFRGIDAAAEPLERFISRLVALAQANDLLTGERWAGVKLRGVIEQAVRSHYDTPDRISISGPDTDIPAKSALALSLALHELATNATKYGAWSRPGGIVSIEWTVEPHEDDSECLKLVWRERGGPIVAPPARRGFGSRLIQRGLASELDGKVEIQFEPTGVVCRIEAPLVQTERQE